MMHELEPNVICPWCDFEYSDDECCDLQDGQVGIIECAKCEKTIEVEARIEISFTSRIPRDECKPHDFGNNEVLCNKCGVFNDDWKSREALKHGL